MQLFDKNKEFSEAHYADILQEVSFIYIMSVNLISLEGNG